MILQKNYEFAERNFMRILFYRYGSICEPDLLETFQKFGYEVHTIELEITNKEVSPQETISVVSDALLAKEYQAVFSINYFPVLSSVCNIFHIRYISWTVDSPVMELYSNTLKNPWNRTFLFDYTDFQTFHPRNPACIFHLPLGVNVERLEKQIQQASSSERKKFSHDICFIGSLYEEKDPYLRAKATLPPELDGFFEGLCQAQMHIYGYSFLQECIQASYAKAFRASYPGFYTPPEEFDCSDTAILSELYLGNHVTYLERKAMITLLEKHKLPLALYTGSNTKHFQTQSLGFIKSLTEMPLAFHFSKINLNPTSKSIRSGIPQRIFDILGAGGFTISNYQSEICENYIPGEHLILYSSLEELTDLTAYYLEHEKERLEIADNGFQYTKAHHTLEQRLETMFTLAFQA